MALSAMVQTQRKYADDFCAHVTWALVLDIVRFSHMFTYAQTAVDAGDIRTQQIMVIFIMGKP